MFWRAYLGLVEWLEAWPGCWWEKVTGCPGRPAEDLHPLWPGSRGWTQPRPSSLLFSGTVLLHPPYSSEPAEGLRTSCCLTPWRWTTSTTATPTPPKPLSFWCPASPLVFWIATLPLQTGGWGSTFTIDCWNSKCCLHSSSPPALQPAVVFPPD